MIIYTDGACSKNGRSGASGGWAYIIHLPDGSSISASEHVPDTTNNRMELMAIIASLERCYGDIVVYSDSQYAIKGITSWIHSWKRCGWKKADGPVKNRDLWEILDMLVSDSKRHVEFRWVRGHNGDPMNEAVDKMAVNASKGG